jgi:hypothetical protein
VQTLTMAGVALAAVRARRNQGVVSSGRLLRARGAKARGRPGLRTNR